MPKLWPLVTLCSIKYTKSDFCYSHMDSLSRHYTREGCFNAHAWELQLCTDLAVIHGMTLHKLLTPFCSFLKKWAYHYPALPPKRRTMNRCLWSYLEGPKDMQRVIIIFRPTSGLNSGWYPSSTEFSGSFPFANDFSRARISSFRHSDLLILQLFVPSQNCCLTSLLLVPVHPFGEKK